jgi:glycosyltransferase involved in cell wall biosynthesis
VTPDGPRIAFVMAAATGGTVRHVAMLAAGFAALGLPVSVFGPEAARNFFESPGAAASTGPPAAGHPAVSYVPLEITARPRPVRDVATVLRLRGLLARERPAVVHAHGLRAAAAASLALLPVPYGGFPVPRRRPALLVTVHNAAPSGALPAAVYATLERLTARRADAVLAVSPDLEGRMRRAGARDVRPAVIAAPAAPAPSAAEVARARADIGAAGHPVLLAVGRLAAQKGLDVLIDAVSRLPDQEPGPLLALAGDGPLAGSLAAAARARGVAVRFLGARPDVPALLAAADVVVLPSRWEGQPLVLQEALRAGRPVVASRVGGIPGLTGEEAALLVPPADPVALGTAIAAVLGDPGLARRLELAAAARAAVLPSADDAVAAAAAVYASLAAAGSATGRRIIS